MRDYCDGNRGKFQYMDYGKRLVLFDGMRYEGRDGAYNVTPTDIDGCIQLDRENCIIFFELKYTGRIPSGQQSALEKICDAVDNGGTDCIIFQAEHKAQGSDAHEPIMARDAIVKQVYWKGGWIQIKRVRNLGEMTASFIQYIRAREEYENAEQITQIHNA